LEGDPTVEKEFDFVSFKVYFGDSGLFLVGGGVETMVISFGI
jgi:hypothetical protein